MEPTRATTPPDADALARLRRTLEATMGVPATEGNAVTVLRNGDAIFPAMLDAIRTSERCIDFLTFVYWTGDIAVAFADALAERARAGVRVRVLLDALGSHEMDTALVDRMRASGVDVERFRPPSWRVWEVDNRTHRKILVCDEVVAFTGGVGIAQEWCGNARSPDEWRDTHFRITGPAVDGLRAGFLDNWLETHQPLWDDDVEQFPAHDRDGSSILQVIRGDAEVGWNRTTALKRALIRIARQRLRITTPYFAPDDVTYDLLVDAAGRGVEIDVLVPGPHADKRVAQLTSERRYGDLLEAGARIWRYQPSMLHAKVLTVDGLLADIGSSNFNHRSFHLDEEIDVVVLDPTVVAALDEQMDDDLARSERVEEAAWDDRGLVQRAAEAASRLVDHQA